jgi:hypothetical protein
MGFVLENCLSSSLMSRMLTGELRLMGHVRSSLQSVLKGHWGHLSEGM